MKRRILAIALVGLLLGVSAMLPAQVLRSPAHLGRAFQHVPKFMVSLDSRNSFISARDVKVMGVRAGLEFDQRVRVGFGTYFLLTEFARTFLPNGQPGRQDTIYNARLKFSYISAYFEYIILQTKRWEVSMPIHLGLGDVAFDRLPEEPRSLLLTEVVLTASYKIFPFLGLGGGIGYRQILAGGDLIRENFNSPTYTYGIRLWTGYLYEKYIKKKPSS